MDIYSKHLLKINKAERDVRLAERKLKMANDNLNKILRLTEVLFIGGEQCVIEVFENGKWKMVGYDREDPSGFSTDPTPPQTFEYFESIDDARHSGIFKRLVRQGKQENVDFRINPTDGPNHL